MNFYIYWQYFDFTQLIKTLFDSCVFKTDLDLEVMKYSNKISAALSKASARERSPTKQYLWRHFLLFSRRTFAGARFA